MKQNLMSKIREVKRVWRFQGKVRGRRKVRGRENRRSPIWSEESRQLFKMGQHLVSIKDKYDFNC